MARDVPRPVPSGADKMMKPNKPSSSRFSLGSASHSPVSSVYYVTFLAIAIISMAQLRCVYESSISLSILLSPASSSSSSASESSSTVGLEHDPYYATILAHLLAPTAVTGPSDDDYDYENDDPAAAGTSKDETAAGKADGGPDEFNGEPSDEGAALERVEGAAANLTEPKGSADEEARRRYYLEDMIAEHPDKADPVELVPDDAVEQIQPETVESNFRDDDAGDDDNAETGEEFTVNSPDHASGEEGAGEEATRAESTSPLKEAVAKIVKGVRSPSQPTDHSTESSGVFLTSDTSESTSPLKEAVAKRFESDSNASPPPTEPGGNSNVYYSVARTDRAGATIRDMVLALAYGYANNKTYGGACYVNSMMDATLRQADKEALIRSVGLQDVLKFACPETYDEGLLPREEYATNERRNRLVNPEFVNWLRSKVVLPELRPGGVRGTSVRGGDAVVHVRRGDVDPCNEWVDRYLPNSYYLEVLRKYVPRNVPVSVFSESYSFEPWTDFSSPRHRVFLDTDLAEVWRAVMSAKYVVLSFSSFVYIPAILNANATVLYAPTWQFVPMPNWIKVGIGIRRKSNAQVKALAEAKCATHESLYPGTSAGRGGVNRTLVRPPVAAEGQ